MTGVRKVLPWLVLTVLVLAGGVFGLRSWVGTEPTDATAAPGVVSESVTATPSADASPSATATPTPSESPSATPTPTRTTSTPRATTAPRRTTAPRPVRSTRSTGAVVARIKSSLDGKGQPTSVWCPPTVPAAVGTTFSCTVAYASAPSVIIADASVRITTRQGEFTWRSSSRS